MFDYDETDEQVVCLVCGLKHMREDRNPELDSCPKCGSMEYRPIEYYDEHLNNFLKL